MNKNKKTYFANDVKCKGEVFRDAPICSHAPVSIHTDLKRPDRPTPGPEPPGPEPPGPTPPYRPPPRRDITDLPGDDPQPPYRPPPRRDITDLPEEPGPPPRRDITDLPEEPRPPPRRKGLNDSSLTTGEIVGIATGTVAGAGALAAGARAATASAEVAQGAGEIEMVGGAGMTEAEFVTAYGGASASGLEGAGAAAAVTEGAAVAETASLLGAETAVLGTSAALAPETLGLSLVVGGLVAGGMAAAGLFKKHPKPEQPPPLSEAGKEIIERYAESDRQQAEVVSRDVMDSDGSGFTREGKHYVEVP